MINQKLLKILACPICHQSLDDQTTENRLVCDHCKQTFSIDDGIIQLIVPTQEILNAKES